MRKKSWCIVLSMVCTHMALAQTGNSYDGKQYSESQKRQARETAETNRHYNSMKPSGSGNNTNYNNNSAGNAYIPELFKTKADKKREQQAKQNEHIAELRGLDKANQEKKETQFKSYTKPSKSPGENWRDRDLDEILINSTMANDTSVPLKRRIEYYEEAFKVASSYNDKSRASYPNADKSKAPVFYSSVLYKNYGVALAQDGQYKKALLHLDKSYLSDRTPFIWMSVSHLMVDDFDKALKGFEQINESDPNYTMATSYCHYLKKDYAKAIQVIERGTTRLDSMKSSRDKSYFKHVIAALQYFNGNTSEAMQTYNALVTKKITSPNELPTVLPDYFSTPIASMKDVGITMLYLLDIQKKLQPDNLYFINSSLNANAIKHRTNALNADQEALDRLSGKVTAKSETSIATPTVAAIEEKVNPKPTTKMTNELAMAICSINEDYKGKHMLVSTCDGYSRVYNTTTGKLVETFNDSLPNRMSYYKKYNIFNRDYEIEGIYREQNKTLASNTYNVVYTKNKTKYIDLDIQIANPYGYSFDYNTQLDYPFMYLRESTTADSGFIYIVKPALNNGKSSKELICGISLKPVMKYYIHSSPSGKHIYSHSAAASCMVDVKNKKVLWDNALASIGKFINRHDGMVFSADEKQCAISTQSGARILDVATGNTLYEIPIPQDLLAKGRHYIAPCVDMQSFLFVLEPDQASRGRKDAIWLVKKGSESIPLAW